jgi:1-acyl-sn-glycerol-3-phosphate acyltransferase
VGSVYKLPGSRFAVRSLAELPRAAAAASVLIGLTPPMMRLAPGRTSRLQRGWGRLARSQLGIDLRITGLGHIDAAQHYVVVALHEGFADVAALLYLPPDLRFVARSELSNWGCSVPISMLRTTS